MARRLKAAANRKGTQSPPPYYLKRLVVKNARCFADVDLSFVRDDAPRMKTVIVGENGHGKTSLLRAIAIGLCQQREASALMGELSGSFVRQNKRGNFQGQAEIIVELHDTSDPQRLVSTSTIVKRDPSGQELVSKTVTPEDLDWRRIFIGGYGVNRGARHREARPGYNRLDASRSLFMDNTSLLDPEGTLRAISLADADGSRNLLKSVKAQLRVLFDLNPNPQQDIEVKPSTVLVHGPWGTMPFHALGDGYRGTAGWILDLLGMALADGRLDDLKELRGIVLLDEIDEHLHPSWQRRLLDSLSRGFPKLQIIGTTHSAMTIVECQPDEIIACELKNAVAKAVQDLGDPSGRTADEILRGRWFGLSSTLDRRSEQLLKKYQKAVRDQRPERELGPIRDKLRERLRWRFDSPLDELALEIAAEVRQQLREQTPAVERKRLVEQAASRLRARIAKKGLGRSRK